MHDCNNSLYWYLIFSCDGILWGHPRLCHFLSFSTRRTISHTDAFPCHLFSPRVCNKHTEHHQKEDARGRANPGATHTSTPREERKSAPKRNSKKRHFTQKRIKKAIMIPMSSELANMFSRISRSKLRFSSRKTITNQSSNRAVHESRRFSRFYGTLHGLFCELQRIRDFEAPTKPSGQPCLTRSPPWNCCVSAASGH